MGSIFTHIKNKYKNQSKFYKLGAQKAFAIFALFLFSVFAPANINASLQNDLRNVNDKIKESQEVLSSIKEERNSLESQISSFNNQISGIEYQISLTNNKINLLNSSIAQTQKDILKAEEELKVANDQLAEFIRVMYEEGQISTIEIIAKSGSFNEFVNRSEYMEQVQLKVKEGADKVVALKNQLDNQQKKLEENKKEAEELRASQVNQRNEVSGMRNAKNSLLAVTKGNEAEYQSLLSKLKKEQQRIQQQIWYGGSYVSLGSVKAGEIIGRIGNSGYSTGCHLHFEIRNTNKVHVNPNRYIGNGYFIHPVPGVPVSAGYGYSSAYFSGIFHTGIDYADGCAGTPIRAAADGEIVLRVTGRPNTFPWSYEYGNYVMIRHTNGMYSLYAHLR